MEQDGLTYPYRVTILQSAGLIQRKSFQCKTYLGAWWLLGHYRCCGFTAFFEIFDPEKARYMYTKSIMLTEYA